MKIRYKHIEAITVPAFLMGLLFLLSIITACQPGNGPAKGTPSPTGTHSPSRTITPTLAPLGSKKNPVIMALVPAPPADPNTENPPDVQSAADDLSRRLSEKTGLIVQIEVLADYKELVQRMQRREIHAAWLPPLTYLYANQNGAAQAILLTSHFGVYQYGTRFIANSNSNYISYYDAGTDKSTGDAPTALAQFQGLRPCWVDPTSASGYIVPAGILAENNITFLPGAYLQSHTSVVRALYIKNICDYGAIFAYSGDPRTASVVQDLPFLMDRIVVIWQSDPIIPNLNLSYIPEMPREISTNLNRTLLILGKADDGRAALTQANNYDIGGLREIKDDLYQPLRSAVLALNIDLSTMLGK